MRETASEAELPYGELDIMEESVKAKMKENGLDWLLNG